MSIRRSIRRLLESITNTKIYSIPPRGTELEVDLRRFLPNYKTSTIFDIGANIGQSALHYSETQPNAVIYSFEPIAETFQELTKNLKNRDRCHCFQIAFGMNEGTFEMMCHEDSSRSQLIDLRNGSEPTIQSKREKVEVTTLDLFCTKNKIEKISYLKIDTEGADLDVLKGAPELLKAQRVDLLEVEVGMNCDNHTHVPLVKFQEFLEPLGYRIFAFYDQTEEWIRREPHLRRVNAVFISSALIESNRTT